MFFLEVESYNMCSKMINLIDLDIDEQSQSEQNKLSVSLSLGNKRISVGQKQPVNLIDSDVDEQDKQVEKVEQRRFPPVSLKTKRDGASRTSLINPASPQWGR